MGQGSSEIPALAIYSNTDELEVPWEAGAAPTHSPSWRGLPGPPEIATSHVTCGVSEGEGVGVAQRKPLPEAGKLAAWVRGADLAAIGGACSWQSHL